MKSSRYFAVTLLLAALTVSLPTNVALAQQILKVHFSGVRSTATRYVEKESEAVKERTGVEFSAKQKTEMMDAIISEMASQGTYNFDHKGAHRK
jgi:hypothetical protein